MRFFGNAGKTLAFVATAFACAGTLAYVRDRPAADATPEVTRKLAELEAEVRKLRSESRNDERLARLSSKLSAEYEREPPPPAGDSWNDADASDAGKIDSDSFVDDPESIAEQRVLAARKASARIAAALDGVYEDEGVDAAYAARTLAGIRSTFAEVEGSSIVDAGCRENLCRIVVEHGSDSSRMALPKAIQGKPPFDREMFYWRHPDSDPPKTTYYLAREGMPLRDLIGPVNRPVERAN
jgi:hypothetical protein